MNRIGFEYFEYFEYIDTDIVYPLRNEQNKPPWLSLANLATLDDVIYDVDILYTSILNFFISYDIHMIYTWYTCHIHDDHTILYM